MPHIPIDPNREYKPSEITQYGFILDTLGKRDYRYILRLITYGKLRARNICKGRVGKIFMVKGQDIINWKKKTIKEMSEMYKPKPPKKSRYTFRNRPFPQADDVTAPEAI